MRGGKGPKTTQRARDAFAMKVFGFIGCHAQDRSQHRAARVGSPPQDLCVDKTGWRPAFRLLFGLTHSSQSGYASVVQP